ncbi:hypothetical protein K439DRAFT_1648243 [Ramaria rubella]|nr:hypothetical protein K439DRAFT_1648243 [Ramaria rubella]
MLLGQHLLQEHAITLGHSIDLSTTHTYNSHLQSYLTFIKLHDFPVEPSIDILSFYVVYMCHHIKPQSVSFYLSGISNSLEHFFPNVSDLSSLLHHFSSSSYDNHLFIAMLLTGFHALLCTGKFTQPDQSLNRDFCKVTLRHTLSLLDDHFSFLLPYHKADCLFQGNLILIHASSVPDSIIQATGRWSSETFCIYVWKHPVLLQTLLHGCPFASRV